ncbi:cytochrome P450 [Mycobacterium sp. LTG2003]
MPLDPDPELLQLLSEDGITRHRAPNGDPVWVVAKPADVRQVFSDRRFSTARTPPTVTRPRATGRASIANPTRRPGGLAGMDPPGHTRLRRMVSAAFSPRRLELMKASVADVVARQLDELDRAGPPADLVSAFAQPVASRTLCELLGLAEEDQTLFETLANQAFDRTLSQDEMTRIFTAMWERNTELVHRQRKSPDDSVVGGLVSRHGDELTDEELTGLINALLIAGHDTTASMLGLGALLLLRHPRELATIRDDPRSVPGAVEEMLRYLSVVQTGLVRTATEDLTLGGQPIKAGDYVMASLVVANRHESVCGSADRFDISRIPQNHLAFGHGTHFCLGATLARIELCSAFPALFRRFPDMRLAVPLEDLRFRTFATVYGVHGLPVEW